MNTIHLHDDDLDAALRALDAADTHLAPEQQARKAALLESILTSAESAPTEAPAAAGVIPLRPRRTRRERAVRWLLPVAAAAGLVGVLTLTGGPGDGPAYASWTPTPKPVTGDTLATAETSCKASMAESNSRMGDVPTDQQPTTQVDTAKTVVAEKRGNYLFLAMATDDGSTAQCFFDAGDPSQIQGMTGGTTTAQSPKPRTLGPRDLEGSGVGSSSGPEGSYAFTQGRVGADIAGVTVHSDGATAEATVSNGYFAAWWPATARAAGAPDPAITYDVTLRNGTVLKNADDVSHDEPAAPGPRQIGRVERGGGAIEGSGTVATAAGVVGEQVTGVTVNVAGQRIVATVSGGTFTAQWPAELTDETPPATYDLTLSDGTVLKAQKPVSGVDS